MLQGIFRTKSLNAILASTEEPEKQLKRTLGAFQLTLLGIGAIIGAGIFSTVGTAAAGGAEHPGAGPAIVVSFVLTAIACGFAALCYAEFASMVPVSGSAYTYAYATLGELVGWIIGWDLIIEYAVGNVAVAISWSGYFQELLRNVGINFPDWLCTDYRSAAQAAQQVAEAHRQASAASRRWAAPSSGGQRARHAPHSRHPARLQPAGLPDRDADHRRAGDRHPRERLVQLGDGAAEARRSSPSSSSWGSSTSRPPTGIPSRPTAITGSSRGAAIIFFAYIGFDAVSTAAEETKNPKRDMPIAHHRLA